MAGAAGVVLSNPLYAILALSMTLLGLTLFVVSFNRTVVDLALTGRLPPAVGVAVIVRLYPFVGTAFGTLDGGLVGVVAVLFGVDVAMLAYCRRERIPASGTREGLAAASASTLVAAVATGGPALLPAILTALGVANTGPVLPLAGFEFALIASAAVLLSIHWLSGSLHAAGTRGTPADRADG